MKRLIACAAVALMSFTAVFAGDAAAFFDIGFSEDGNTYVFGEYGKTDISYQAWAEIYAVDVAKNDFVKDEVFKTKPSKSTASLTGKVAFEELQKKANWKLKKYRCLKSDPENLLYIRDVASPDANEIIFKDFDSSDEDSEIFYHIKLIPSYEGTGKSLKSKYYIEMKRQNDAGDVLKAWTVGNPDIQRNGVSSYQIERIFTDKTKQSLVFVVQKTIEDSTGTSIRYMVETLSLR